MISCKKEVSNDNKNKRTVTDRDRKVTRLLLNFKKNLDSKSGESMNTDSAVWYVEGLLNLENAYNEHLANDLTFFKDSILLTPVNGTLSMEQIDEVYSFFTEKINDLIARQNNPAFQIDLIDIHFSPTLLKDGEMEMIMDGGGGYYYPYTPFGPEDYWYWGWNLGKCGGYSGGQGIDAADKLEYKFNHPIDFVVGDYYTDVETAFIPYYTYEDPSSPSGYYQFIRQGEGNNPPEEPCISPYELNYYLSKFEYIKADNQPYGKSFIKVDVIDDDVPYVGHWLRCHNYELYYGIESVNPN